MPRLALKLKSGSEQTLIFVLFATLVAKVRLAIGMDLQVKIDMKQILLALLGFILLSMPLAAIAQQEGGFCYSSDGSTITITGYAGEGGDLTIPNAIGGLPVTSIGSFTFQFCSSLNSVIIPSGVTNIGNDAFWSCYNLASVTIPDSVVSIDEFAFSCCFSLTNITIGDGVTSIEDGAFTECINLTSITIPNSVTNIGGSVFDFCGSLTNATIPCSVIHIGDAPFGRCFQLVITVDASNAFYSSVDGFLFNKSQTKLIECPSGFFGSYAVPKNVTSIGNWAFISCSNLTDITIPDGVTNIGLGVFQECSSLTNVIIPNGVTSLGENFFLGCSSLTSITISTNVTSIGASAFAGCSGLTNITIPSGVRSIGTDAFGGCSSLMNIAVDVRNASFSSLDGILFNKRQTMLIQCPRCKTGRCTIPNSVTSIADRAFEGCSSLTNVTISSGITSIGKYVFSGCSELRSITIPSKVTSIEYGAFAGCSSLVSVTIPDSVISIGDWAFGSCSALTDITIPSSVLSIQNDAFFNCVSLVELDFLGNAPSVSSSAFNSTRNVIIYYLPWTTGWEPTFGGCPTARWASPVADFTYAINDDGITITGYTGSGSDVSIPESINGVPIIRISDYAFQHCNLTSVAIPASVTDIGGWAFCWCFGLTNILVDAANASYSDSDGILFDKSQTTLIQCPNGKVGDVTFPDTVTNIGGWAFYYCTNLASIRIPGSVNVIGDNAFCCCIGLTNVTIPDSVISIGDGAFRDCLNLIAIDVDAANGSYTSVDGSLISKSQSMLIQCPGGRAGGYTVPSIVTSIGYEAFWNSSHLTSISIPIGVTNIARGAFIYCSNLKAFTVDEANAAYSEVDGILFNKSKNTLVGYPCSRIGEFTIPSNVTTIGDGAFFGCAGLTGVTMSNGLAIISQFAFYSCTSLTSIMVPDSVISIGDSAFSHCTGLTNIIIPSSVVAIEDGMCNYCTNLTSIAIPDSIVSIGDSAFYSCNRLTNVAIPGSVISIGYGAFGNCSSLEGAYFQGNAPVMEGVMFNVFYAFSGSEGVTVYYLPGTTGWGWDTTFFLPTALWNPVIQPGATGSNGFSFNINGTPDIPIVVEACDNLVDASWVALHTNILTEGTFYFSDTDSTNHPSRFYRIRSP